MDEKTVGHIDYAADVYQMVHEDICKLWDKLNEIDSRLTKIEQNMRKMTRPKRYPI